MVSDAVFSANTPSIELLERMSHQDFSQNVGTEQFSQLQIKSRIAEFIRIFKMQLFTEAKLYFEAMDGVIEQGDNYFLPQDPTTASVSSSSSSSDSTMGSEFDSRLQQQYTSIGFQSQEAVRLTFQYAYMDVLKAQRDGSKSGSKGRNTGTQNRRTRREASTSSASTTTSANNNKTTRAGSSSSTNNEKSNFMTQLEKFRQSSSFIHLLVIVILSGLAYFLLVSKKKVVKAVPPPTLNEVSTLDWIEGKSDKKKGSVLGKGKEKEKKSKPVEDKKIRNRSSSSVPMMCISNRSNSKDKLSATNLSALATRPSEEYLTTITEAAPTSSAAAAVVVEPVATVSSSSGLPLIADNSGPARTNLGVSPSMEDLMLRLQEEEEAYSSVQNIKMKESG